MTPTAIRWLIYLAGIGATGLQLAQLGAWDSASMTFDLYPFRVDDAVRAAVSGSGNLLAMVAVWRGWGIKR